MKKTAKIITAIISMLLTLSIIFVAVSATDSGTPAATETTENALLYSDVREVTSLRTETVKHFRLPDGTYQMVYYAEPIHRLDADGVWQNIDNTLSVKAANGTQKLATPDARAAFAPSFAFNSNILTLSENGYTVSMAMLGGTSGVSKMSATATAAPVVANAPQSSNATSWSTLEEATSIDNSSSIVYQNVALNTDLEYVLQNNRIKENIIVRGVQDGYSYAFTLTLSGLTAELEASGRVSISDAETAEPKYVIPAPYMYDANGNLSYDVTYTLTEVKTGMYLLTVEADETWINASIRAFPVTIYPTLIPSVGVYDTYVSSATPSTVYGAASYMEVNSTSTALIKYNMYGFGIPEGVTVNNTYLRIPCYNTSTSSATTTVSIEEPTEGWSDSSAYLPTSTYIKSNYFTTTASSSLNNPNTVSVLVPNDIVIDWMNSPQTNYGVALKYLSGNQTLRLVAYDSGVAHATLCVEYTYNIPSGIYGFSNDSYSTYWLNVSSNATAGSAVTSKSVSSSHALSIADRDILFKITRTDAGAYIIRSMIDNTLGLSTTSSSVVLKSIAANDSSVALADMFKIEWDGYGFLLYPYNNTSRCIKLGSSGALSFVSAPTVLSASHWNLEEYTPSATDNGNYGVTVPETMLTGETLTITPNKWTTTIGANEPYIYATNSNTNAITKAWNSETKTFTLNTHYPDDVTIYFSYNQSNTVVESQYELKISTISNSNELCLMMNDVEYLYIQANNPSTIIGTRLNNLQYKTWIFQHIIDDYYYIRFATNPTFCLTAPGSSVNTNGTAPTLISYNGNDNQVWKIASNGSSRYLILSKVSELSNTYRYLSISQTPNSQTTNYSITQTNLSSNEYRSWHIEPVVPTIGGELPYETDDWDTYSDYNNCYAYAINNLAKNDIQYDDTQQPGEYSGNSISNIDESTLTLEIYEDLIIEAVIADYTQLLSETGFSLSANDCFIEVPFDYETPNTSMYKVALKVDSDWDFGKSQEVFYYHWYRQNPDGFWSHKVYTTHVTNLDDSGNLIVNPNLADDVYSNRARFFVLVPWSAIRSAAGIQSTQNLPTNASETERTEIAILSYGKYEKEDAA